MTASRQIQGLQFSIAVRMTLTGLLVAFAGIRQSTAQDSREIRIGVIPGVLKYDMVRFDAAAGESLTVTFGNNGLMQHNWLLVKPGKADAVVSAAMALGSDGLAASFIPDSDDVLQSTPLVDPGQSVSIRFEAPENPGEYPYVCTFPGHGIIMRGVMVVKPASSELEAPVVEEVEQIRIRNNFEGVTYTTRPEGSPEKPFVIRTYMPDPGIPDEVFANHGKGMDARRYSPDRGDDVEGTVPPIDGVPAAIGLNYGNELSVCFDTLECRLLYAWTNGFLNMDAYWGRGPGGGRKSFDYVPRLEGDLFFMAEGRHPVTINGNTPALKFKSIGYDKGIPTLSYQCSKSRVSEKFAVTGENSFSITYELSAAEGETLVYSIPESLAAMITPVDGSGNTRTSTMKAAPGTTRTQTIEFKIQ